MIVAAPPTPAYEAPCQTRLHRRLVTHVTGTAPGPRRDDGCETAPPRYATAGALLGHVSTVALASDIEPVGEHQYVYVRSMVRSADLTSGKAVTEPLHRLEVRYSQQPGRAKRIGWMRENGELLPINAELGDRNGTPVGLARPTYSWLASLPEDPAALLRYLYKVIRTDRYEDPDQAVFQEIGDLIADQVVPPRTAAALYRAAARIPGVTTRPDAADVIGRRGPGIARADSFGHRTEWVFDADDSTFLGSRTFLTRPTGEGPAGTMLAATTVQQRAAVNRPGERPHT